MDGWEHAGDEVLVLAPLVHVHLLLSYQLLTLTELIASSQSDIELVSQVVE
jgi:hypothetical protein